LQRLRAGDALKLRQDVAEVLSRAPETGQKWCGNVWTSRLSAKASRSARQIFLGDTLDSENMQANFEHGVLTLTILVAETAKPRRVQISGSKYAQTIEPQTAGGAQAQG
jgi:hypothetical protein